MRDLPASPCGGGVLVPPSWSQYSQCCCSIQNVEFSENSCRGRGCTSACAVNKRHFVFTSLTHSFFQQTHSIFPLSNTVSTNVVWTGSESSNWHVYIKHLIWPHSDYLRPFNRVTKGHVFRKFYFQGASFQTCSQKPFTIFTDDAFFFLFLKKGFSFSSLLK